MTVSRLDRAFVALPDPGEAGTLDELVAGLRSLKIWAGDPSYDTIKDRINITWRTAGRPGGELARRTTVADCFKTGRRRLNTELVLAVVRALHPDVGYGTQWRQALRVIGGETSPASQVRVQDFLPRDLAGFTGRAPEVLRLRQALRDGERDGGAVVISTIAGMAGVGKTQLAIHVGHLLARERPYDRVLFVNLRGFEPDPAQPPADPAAVLDGFLRLLGVPGQRIPHDPRARTAAFRDRLAGSRTLVILDNAADTGQVRPLLPTTAGCTVLVTSRRNLTDLEPAIHLAVDVFTAGEAEAFLARSAPGIPVGADAGAIARIARRCGHLPLALALLAGHLRGTPGWTLTDHADRLDERHHDRRLDSGVELAIDLSYQHLPDGRQRLLRLAALHPGHDLDAYAAAALTGTDLATAEAGLAHLHRDQVLQQAAPGRYTLHDLIRAYATGRATDLDPPPDRRAALTRLFDYYLATAAAAMDTLAPAEAHQRPRIPAPGTPVPAPAGPDAAVAWLDTERPALVAVAAHAATHGWPTHAIRLSRTLFRYLDGGHATDALAIHGHALDAAGRLDDPAGRAHALTNLGAAHRQMGRYAPAADHFRRARRLFEQAGDRAGQARTLGNLALIEERLGQYRPAADHSEQALHLFRQAGDHAGETRTLISLGIVEGRLGRARPAADHLGLALSLYRRAGDRIGEATALLNLGEVEQRAGRPDPATGHLEAALALFRSLGSPGGVAWTLDSLGICHRHTGRTGPAAEHHREALALFREIGDRTGEACALNGLGEAATAGGHAADALTEHGAARTVAADIGAPDEEARAHAGLGHAHRALADPDRARHHYQQALTGYADLGVPEADQVRAHLAATG